jgi:ferredoxin
VQKQYKIQGIRRNLPDNVADDFSAAEIINLREKNGVWRPTGEKEEIITDNLLAGANKYAINENCVACGACVANCPYNAIIYNSTNNNYHINQSDCTQCGNCHESCNYNAVEYARIFQDNQKITLFLHTTGDTKQMIGLVNGSVKYFNFPNGQTVSTILDLPRADAGRRVRFNAVGNILVIFVEPDTGQAPYTKYAIWKADANNVKKYYVLPDLQLPRIEYGLVEDIRREKKEEVYVEHNLGKVGIGLLLASCKTISGDYIKTSAPVLVNYGMETKKEDNYYGKLPVIIFDKNKELIPEGWEDIIESIDIFSTVLNVGYNFQDNIDLDAISSDDFSTFYKIASFRKNFIKSQLLVRATATITDISAGGSAKIGSGEYASLSITSISHNTLLDTSLQIVEQRFLHAMPDGNPYFLNKSTNAPVKLFISIGFHFRDNSIIDNNPYNSYPTDSSLFRLFIKNLDTGQEITLPNANSPVYSTDGMNFYYSGSHTLRQAGQYSLQFSYTPGHEYAFRLQPLGDFCYFSIYDALEINGKVRSILSLPEKDILLTKPPLEIPLTHDLYGHCDLNYNSRLFLGDTTSLLFKGYSGRDYGGEEDSLASLIEQSYVVYLRTEDGEKIVRSDWAKIFCLNAQTNRYYLKLPTLISYPDYRAYKAALYLRKSGKIYKFREYDLTANKDHNFSYSYIYAFGSIMDNTLLLPTTLSPKTGTGSDYSLLLPDATVQLPAELSELGLEETALPDTDNAVRTVNNTAVSALHLPMCYPAKHYNMVGNKKVIAFSANNLSIDATNFGIYPVFVFSQNGVYAMELGTGDVLVTRIVPLSGDVCMDKNSVANIGRATLFASIDGLRILQGQRSEKITALLENYTGNPLAGNRHFNAILEKYGMTAFISPGDFQTFLHGARTYLAYKENEVVITNEAFPYSYILHLNDGIKISKTSERYYNILNDYPNAYGTSENGAKIYSIGNETTDGTQKILLQTNAFKLGADEFEKIDRLIARLGVSPMNAGHCGLGIYLFASNDTRKWTWVDACEINPLNAPGGALNAAPLRCPNSAKYGMIVIAGEMNRTKDFITHISIDYQKRYDNKIR